MLDTQPLRQGTIEVTLDELSNEEVFKTHSKKIELIDRSYARFLQLSWAILNALPVDLGLCENSYNVPVE